MERSESDLDRTSMPPGRRPEEPAPRTAKLEQEIETELVKHLVRQAPIGFAIGTLTVAVIVLVLWNAAPRTVLLAWLASMGFLSLPSFVVVWRFMRAAPASGEMASWRRGPGPRCRR